MKNILALGLFAALLMGFPAALVYAQEATAEELQVQIAGLLNRIEELRNRISTAQGGAPSSPSPATASSLQTPMLRPIVTKRVLGMGMRGEDVRALQELLSVVAGAYPEKKVTGYFGQLTEKAVQRFQVLNEIVDQGTPRTTGYGQVGPRTLRIANEVIATINEDPERASEIVDVEFQTTPPPVDGGLFPATDGSSFGTTDGPPVPPVAIGEITDSGPSDTTSAVEVAPDTAPLVVGSILFDTNLDTASGLDRDGTFNLSWVSNKNTTGRVYIDAAYPVNAATAKSFSTPSGTVHDLSVSVGVADDPNALAHNTTYYFMFEATDVMGNKVTSALPSYMFRTGSVLDETGPVIGSATVSNISGSSAQIQWSVQDASPIIDQEFTLMYGTTADSALETGMPIGNVTHSGMAPAYQRAVTLSGLTSNTTYYYVIMEEDVHGNMTVSEEKSFTTGS